MARRLVLKTTGDEMSFHDLQLFVEGAKKLGIDASASIDVDVENEGANQEVTIVRFGVTVPNDRLVTGERVKIKKKTKKQRAVENQIKEHKEKKQNGKKEAYVPPVGRTSPPKPSKIKCPECNIRKPIQTVGGVKAIKPHVSHGDPCPGSGLQVKKSGKTWKIA